MKINTCNPDNTQSAIYNELLITEKLLSRVASKLSGKEKIANIHAMPDLGISSNVTRMCGGFFTGMCATWETDVPFIPVDATVNVCGTAVYRLSKNISPDEFKNRVENILKTDKKYDWNYNKGNHFVILAKSDGKEEIEKGQYLILHASAAEYKKQNMEEGLYPVIGNWYYDSIQTQWDETSNRYLRYISGEKAIKFYNIANMLINFNAQRNRYFAQKVMGDLIEEEIVNIPHYGMPNQNSVCIGTQWINSRYTLLTAPGKDIYIIDPIKDSNKNNYFKHCGQEYLLSPHGFGLQTNNDTANIYISSNKLKIEGKEFEPGQSINIDIDATVRGENENNELIKNRVNNVLNACNGKVVGKLNQIASITKRGYIVY